VETLRARHYVLPNGNTSHGTDGDQYIIRVKTALTVEHTVRYRKARLPVRRVRSTTLFIEQDDREKDKISDVAPYKNVDVEVGMLGRRIYSSPRRASPIGRVPRSRSMIGA
jgi:hypothetical protein